MISSSLVINIYFYPQLSKLFRPHTSENEIRSTPKILILPLRALSCFTIWMIFSVNILYPLFHPGLSHSYCILCYCICFCILFIEIYLFLYKSIILFLYAVTFITWTENEWIFVCVWHFSRIFLLLCFQMLRGYLLMYSNSLGGTIIIGCLELSVENLCDCCKLLLICNRAQCAREGGLLYKGVLRNSLPWELSWLESSST